MAETVEIRYFAAVRERLERGREELEIAALEGAPDVGAVWSALVDRHPELERLRPHVRLAVNGEFADDETPVEAGDELAIIPPVAGGAEGEGGPRRFAISREPLEARGLRELVARDEAGAVVVFEGTVRDHTDDHDVERLEYECYEEMALAKLREVGEAAADREGDLEVAIHHRVGALEVGETAVVVACSSPHRGPAFDACRFAIDRLKEVVPIWKKEIGPEGEDWVGWGP